MLKLDFIMPKHKKGRKTTKRNRSLSPAISEGSERSTESEVPIPTTTKEPEAVEVAEPTLTQDSIGDTPIPPSQPDTKKRQKNSVILSDDDEMRVVEWLAEHPLMYNKKIEEYKETDMKEKLWEELGEELGFTGRHKLNFYLLLLVLGPLHCWMFEVIRSVFIWMVLVYVKLLFDKLYWGHLSCSC